VGISSQGLEHLVLYKVFRKEIIIILQAYIDHRGGKLLLRRLSRTRLSKKVISSTRAASPKFGRKKIDIENWDGEDIGTGGANASGASKKTPSPSIRQLSQDQ